MTDIIIQNNGEDLSSKMKNNKNGNFSNKNTQKSESNNSDKKINENITDLNSLKSKLKGIKFIDGQFEIEDCIGSGGESKVYILLNHKRKRACSLKVIENIKKERNLNELNIATKLKNSNIINYYLYFLFKGDDNDYIIMENAKYGNLRDFTLNTLKTKNNCLSESMLCYISYQILNGLYHCHKCKIAHMDIKPQNIVICEVFTAKIIDFSISIDYSGKDLNEKIKVPYKGTNFYMSQEVFNREEIKYKDLNKIDAYSFGVLLFRLAFGYYPYGLEIGDEDNDKIILEKIKGRLEIKNERHFSSYFVDLVEKLLENNISKRISIYEAMEHPWIKGASILNDEKENTYYMNKFISNLSTNNIKKFNDYLKLHKK